MIFRFQAVLASVLLLALIGCRCASNGAQYSGSKIRYYESQKGLVKRYTQLLELRIEDASSTNLTVLSSNEVAEHFKSICEAHAHIKNFQSIIKRYAIQMVMSLSGSLNL